MIHVDDWLDDPANKDHVGRAFLEHARRPAMDKDHAWLAANRPTAMWMGRRYHVVGASRLGDVWLKPTTASPNDHAYYDHRVAIEDLYEWLPPSGDGKP